LARWRSAFSKSDSGPAAAAGALAWRFTAQELRAKLASDIAELTTKAEAADAEDTDPQALRAELARREAVKAKLDAACARMEAAAKAEAAAARPGL
jgi:hypothetical protein